MKIFIFTYDRYDTLSTPAFFEKEGIDHTILCHSEEAKEKFIQGGLVSPDRIIATLEPKGLANNRNWATNSSYLCHYPQFACHPTKSSRECYSFATDNRCGTLKNVGKAEPILN